MVCWFEVCTALLDLTKRNSDASTKQYTCKRMLHDRVMPVMRAQAKTAAMPALVLQVMAC